jgi:adenylate cyclase
VYRPESDARFNEALKALTQDKQKIFFPMIRRPPESDHQGDLMADIATPLGLIKTDRAQANARAAFQPPLAIALNLWQVGTINFHKDADGVGRRYDLYTDVYGWLAPSLPAKVATALAYPVPRQDNMLLAWRGGKFPFKRISYADLYHDFERAKPQRDPRELQGKIVIIGTDASALHDIRVTPIDSLYSGLDILATAIDNLKNQRSMQMPPRWMSLAVCMSLLLAIYLCFWRRINALYPGLALIAVTLLSIIGSYFALSSLLLVPVVTPLLLIWTYYFALALREYWLERLSRQKTVQLFSRFVNPHVVKELVSFEGLSRAGESREITVLFSDIRGFTSLSENRTPQEVVSLLNRYFSLQVEVIFRHGGSLDKFIGDCIMAFWGAPLDDAAHALHAVQAAQEMAEVLQQFKRELGDLEADFDVGIGLHSGPAVVGLIGSEQRKEYTAIGDTVNLASRIEGLTKGISRILVSRDTMLLCSDKLDFQALGSYKVKGREQEVELFAPVSPTHGEII